jgi:hypothetical protein
VKILLSSIIPSVAAFSFTGEFFEDEQAATTAKEETANTIGAKIFL